MKKLKKNVKRFMRRHKGMACMLAVMAVTLMGSVSASATSGDNGGGTADYSAITNAMSNGLSGLQTSLLGVIGTVMPYAITVMGAGILITVGIKVFKRVTGKA